MNYRIKKNIKYIYISYRDKKKLFNYLKLNNITKFNNINKIKYITYNLIHYINKKLSIYNYKSLIKQSLSKINNII